MVWPAMFIMMRTNRELIAEVNDRFAKNLQKPPASEEESHRVIGDAVNSQADDEVFLAYVCGP